jgi:hypothetical protein
MFTNLKVSSTEAAAKIPSLSLERFVKKKKKNCLVHTFLFVLLVLFFFFCSSAFHTQRCRKQETPENKISSPGHVQSSVCPVSSPAVDRHPEPKKKAVASPLFSYAVVFCIVSYCHFV